MAGDQAVTLVDKHRHEKAIAADAGGKPDDILLAVLFDLPRGRCNPAGRDMLDMNSDRVIVRAGRVGRDNCSHSLSLFQKMDGLRESAEAMNGLVAATRDRGPLGITTKVSLRSASGPSPTSSGCSNDRSVERALLS